MSRDILLPNDIYIIEYKGDYVDSQDIQDRLYKQDYVDFINVLADKYSLNTNIVTISDIDIFRDNNDKIKLLFYDWEYDMNWLRFKFNIEPVKDIDTYSEYMKEFFVNSTLVINYNWYFEKIEQNYKSFYLKHPKYVYGSSVFYSVYSSENEVNTDNIINIVEKLNKLVKEMSNKTVLYQTSVNRGD